MSWHPPPRAEWVGAFNSGDGPRSGDHQLPPGLAGPTPSLADIANPDWFRSERLLTEALLARGFAADDLARFGPDDFVEPLSVFVSALAHEAKLHPLGRWIARRYIERLLDGRIALHAEEVSAIADPVDGTDPADAPGPAGVAGRGGQQIKRPIFVVGAPRTGTTALYRMLAAVDGLRAPEGWEFLYPCPSGRDRITDAGHELVLPQTMAAGLDQIHSYSATMPKECLSAMAFSFRTEEFISRFDVPSYVDWLGGADMTPAYSIHRRVLQALQSPASLQTPASQTERWVLKSPVHLGSLPTLLQLYPDATLVVTHRAPAEVLASVTSLICTLRSAFSDEVDPHQVGAYHLQLYAQRLDDLVTLADSELLVHRTHHLSHHDLITDPTRCVAELLDELAVNSGASDPRPPATIGTDPNRVLVSVVDPTESERSDALGRHQYNFADFGLDPNRVNPQFTRYCERFL